MVVGEVEERVGWVVIEKGRGKGWDIGEVEIMGDDVEVLVKGRG